MPAQIVEQIKVIDIDTHVSEPPGVWTKRVSQKWGDLVPHVGTDPKSGDEVWLIGDTVVRPTAQDIFADFAGHFPDHAKSLAVSHPGAYDAKARLAYMDKAGLYAQVLYPNFGGFGSGRFLELKEPELM